MPLSRQTVHADNRTTPGNHNMKQRALKITVSGFITALLCTNVSCNAALNALDQVDNLLNGDILVLIINDASDPVRPDIQFDESDNGLQALIDGLVGGNALNTPDLAAGDFVQYQFSCDELGLIYSDQSELRTLFGGVDAPASTILTRGDDFDCGDEIRFEFFGDRNSFNLLVTVNGRVVD
jgi:hypothetical protein